MGKTAHHHKIMNGLMLSASAQRLSVRQRRFCLAYIATGNGAKSARMAGYAVSGARQEARRTLSKDYVQDFIEETAGAAESAKGLTLEHVVARLIHEAKNGDVAGARVRALELLGKTKGAFSDQPIGAAQKPVDSLVLRLARTQPDAARTIAVLLGVELSIEMSDTATEGGKTPVTIDVEPTERS